MKLQFYLFDIHLQIRHQIKQTLSYAAISFCSNAENPPHSLYENTQGQLLEILKQLNE